MKKGVIVMMFLCLVTGVSQAQFFKGFLRQKGENRKLLAKQIIALNVYSGYIKRGYNVARDGLRLVNDVKDGEFSLHKDYFNSLKAVSPAIRKYSRVAEIIALQERTIRQCGYYTKSIRADGFFKPDEFAYLGEVFGRVLKDCYTLVALLGDLTTSGKYEMTDAERIKRIDGLYLDALSQYEFVEVFGYEAVALGRQRQLEMLDSEKVGSWYGSDQ